MTFSPKFSIVPVHRPDGVSIKARLALQADDTFSVTSHIGTVNAHDFESIAVYVLSDGDDIAILLKGEPDSVARIATVTPRGLSEDQKDAFRLRLANAVDEAFGSAMFDVTVRDLQPAVASGRTGPASAVEGGAGQVLSGRPSRATLGVIAAVVALSVGLMGFGVLRNKPDQAPEAEVTGPDSAMTARIRQQIDQAVRNPSTQGGFNGTNVALETMRAMGLNPGKANAGCLVGAH